MGGFSAVATIRRSWATLALALLLVTVLGLIGLDVEAHLEPTSLTVPGTASAHGQALADAHPLENGPTP